MQCVQLFPALSGKVILRRETLKIELSTKQYYSSLRAFAVRFKAENVVLRLFSERFSPENPEAAEKLTCS